MDEQHTEFPHGTLGVLNPPKVSVVEGMEAEIALAREFRAGRLGALELAMRLEALQKKAVARTSVLEP